MLSIAGLPAAIADLVQAGGFSPLGFLFSLCVIICLMGMIPRQHTILLIMSRLQRLSQQSLGIESDAISGIVTQSMRVEIGFG